jgi:hypothetical protein
MFLKTIACEIAFREICACAARSPNQFDLEFLSEGYHDNPEVGLQRIQERIDAVEPDRFDRVLVGYGLCNNMLAGLQARDLPLVIPRAHDCITFFLGSRAQYQSYFMDHPGTYYYTAGWLEYRQRGGERPSRKQGSGLGQDQSYEEMVAKYGEDNAQYLRALMDNWTHNYTHGVYIDFDFTTHLPCREQVQELCRQRGWAYEEVRGDLGLLQGWLDGPWTNGDFLLVEPGQAVVPSHGDDIIRIESA